MERLIRNLYSKYAPEKNIDEQIRYVQQKYGNDATAFVSDFYAKYAPDRLTQKTVDHINKNYFSQPTPTNNQKEEEQEESGVIDTAIDWFGQTWFGSGVLAATTTGEANNLMAEDFSNINMDVVQDFIEAKQDEINSYVPSETMNKFSEQYVKEGSTWTAWWRGVKKHPELLPELLVQSFGTQVGTLIDSPKASITGMLTGIGIGGSAGARLGGKAGAITGGISGAMGGLATTMEAALTFGELIEVELEKEGKKFTDENIKDLLERKGSQIRNKAVGRGLTIGAIEGLSGAVAGKVARTIKSSIRGTKRGIAAAGAGGVGVEAIGGGLGEVGGRLVAGQEMDPAEIGFEAVTGTTTAPLNVGAALITAKKPTYSINGEKVSYDTIKDFVDTADDIDVAKAVIKIRNDFTGIGKKAEEKQNNVINAIKDSGDEAKIKEVAKARRDNLISETIAFAEASGKKIGKDVLVVDDDIGAQAAYDNIAKELNLKAKDVTGADGFIVGDSIVINKDVAGRTGQINVGGHEILHGILNKHYKSLSDAQKKEFVSGFLNTISSESKAYVEKILKQRIADGEDLNLETTQEWLTVYSDGIVKEQITFNEGLSVKLQNFLQEIFRKFGYNKEFDSGVATYNFMRDYQKSIQQGALSQRAIDAAGGGTQADLAFSREASDNVQSIYDSQGAAGAFDIINLFKPITNKLVEKRRGAPNFDKTLLTEEIETGERGIIDLINEYNPESGVPLAAYINKFLPARAIEASRRILGEEFTTDITEARGVAAEEVATPEVQTKPKARKINPIDLARDDKIKQEYIEKVAARIKDVDLSKATLKTLKDLAADVTAKVFNVPEKKITDATANLTKQEKENALKFIRANALDLIALLPEGAITEAASEKLIGTSTGVPKSLLNKFYTKQDRITKGAGLSPYTKNANINKKEFLEAFGIVEGKKSTDFGPRTPEAQAVKAMMSLYGKLATNTAVRQELVAQEDKQQEIQDLSAGISPIQFSADRKAYLESKGYGDQYIDIKTSQDVDFYVDVHIPILRQVFGDDFLESTMYPGTLNAEIYTGLRAQIKDKNVRDYFGQRVKEITFKPINKPKKGEGKFSSPKPRDVFSDKGILTGETIRQNLDKVEAHNKQVSSNFRYGWLKIFDMFNKEIKVNGRVITKGEKVGAVMMYLHNSTMSVTHWHRNGATLEGVDFNAVKVHLEHVLQNIRVARILMDAALESNTLEEYTEKLDKVQEKYHMFAIDDSQNTKIDRTKYYDPNSKYEGATKKDMVSYKHGMGVDFDYLTDEPAKRYANKDIFEQQGGLNLKAITILKSNKNFIEHYKMDVDGTPLTDEEIKIMQEAETSNEAMFDQLVKNKPLKQQEKNLKTIDEALNFSRTPQPEKGISIFDFDDTLAISDSKVIVKLPAQIVGGKQYGYETWDNGRIKMTSDSEVKITAAEFARDAEGFESIGATFDFREFSQVKNAKKGPFFELAQKIKGKFGNKDIFILTARPQNAAPAIQKFLKGVGLDIRLENITGLEDGSPQAKAQFVTEKVAEGYNNFFFGDDAYKNVKAVQDVLDVADVKSDVQQAKIQFSKSLDSEFNKIIEDNKGIPENAEFSEAAAKVRGAQSDKFWSRLFVPPSAEDFKGLLYMLIGKGKKGEAQMAFLEESLIKPFARAYKDMNAAKEKISNQYKLLTSEFKDVKKKLLTATDYNNFTFDQAVRVYLMNKNEIEIPGISKRDTEALTKIVENDQRLKDFADKLSGVIGLEEGYVTPNDVNWLASTIEMDIKSVNNDIKRSEYLNEWIENKNVIFSEKNLNKLEALYGTSYRNALEDILYRMETGSNRQKGNSKLVNQFTDWINNATGNIMFLNVRSSVLQVLSFTNFINWSDNNPIKYAAAVANFPQFAKDFAMIWNSDFLKQRRSGLQTDVSASEIMNQAANSKNKIGAMISYILGKGYLPTQMGDSFAICLGGAGFYRNRLNTYLKQGLSQTEAENKAFQDFAETSEDAQQSARPDKISEQQAGPLGRFILAFQNTPMQYTRMIKKAALDLANGRGDAKTNISKIIYYGAMQNFIFSALQNALFALAFDEEEDEKTQQRYSRIANNMSDTILRGTGIYGAAASTLKNIALQFIRQEQKGHRADHAYTVIEGINLSPPIGSKIRKLYSATQAIKFNRDEVAEMGFHIDNPAYDAIANTTSAITNIPLDRAIRITDNARAALDKNNQAWQRIALVLGWNTWDLGIEQNKSKKTRKKKNNKRVLF